VPSTRSRTGRSAWLWTAAIAGYAFLYLPLVIVVVYSFNNSRLNAEWVGFTLDWYRKLAHNEEMQQAAANSLVIGFVTSLVSTVLGTMAGVAMHKYKLRLLPILVLTPIAIPEILMGVSLLIFFVLLNFSLGLVSVTLAHIAFCIAYVVIVVSARLRTLSPALEEAAMDLGANPWQAFWYVTLPALAPGILAGLILAFAKAMGEFGATITFVSNIPGETQTISAAIYTYTQVPGGDESALRLTVVAIVIALAALFASEIFQKMGEKRIASLE